VIRAKYLEKIIVETSSNIKYSLCNSTVQLKEERIETAVCNVSSALHAAVKMIFKDNSGVTA
jgi:hypothetical protein